MTWAKWPELQDGDDVAQAATPVRLRRLILDAIQAGELRPGARLKETELVAALSVSRTPLREALAALRAEGILERDDDGLRVRRLDWHDVRGLYELRGTLEGLQHESLDLNRTASIKILQRVGPRPNPLAPSTTRT